MKLTLILKFAYTFGSNCRSSLRIKHVQKKEMKWFSDQFFHVMLKES